MNDNNIRVPKVFISYSHDSIEHSKWVYEFACKLIGAGIDVFLDQFDTRLGDDLTEYMETAVAQADRVLIICTEIYSTKANARTAGVGYETILITGELHKKLGTHKFIPIVKQGMENPILPKWLGTRLYVNLSKEDHFADEFNRLVNDIHNIGEAEKPPIGKGPNAVPKTAGLPCIFSNNITREKIPIPLGWETTIGTPCPLCKDGKLVFSRYDIGPFSRNSEYYICDKCKREFPTVIPFTGGTD